MPVKSIQKRSNPIIRRLRQIRDGKSTHLLFCEGQKLLKDLLKSEFSVLELYCIKEKQAEIAALFRGTSLPKLTVLSPDVMRFVSDLKSPPGVLAIAESPASGPLPAASKTNPLVLILHGIQDPYNVGTLLRTAEAAGVSEVWTTPSTCDPFGPKVVRGSSGSLFRIPLIRGKKLKTIADGLKQKGIPCFAAVPTGRILYDSIDWKKPSALLLGSEGSGLTPDDLAVCSDTISIPMTGPLNSLNVAASGAICLFECARQRRNEP